MFGVDGALLSRQYKHQISNFFEWKQLHHASDYVIFKENLSDHISMDETCLSQGELYTILTAKPACGNKGALIAMIKGTNSKTVIEHLKLMPRHKRLKVKEISIDLSPAMKLIAQSAFPNATIVSDRFHVQKLMNQAVSDLRVDYRWQAIDQENSEMQLAKELGRRFAPHTFENGDSRRQLLARSRHIVMKHFSKWTDNQRRRADILFREYPYLKQAYDVSMELTQLYNSIRTTKDKKVNKHNIRQIALLKLAHWHNRVEALGCKFFNSVITTMQNNYGTITNYFVNRTTNAAAESFNAKVKAFRSQFRGVRDISFFTFRLSKIFA